jgi:phenylacetate-CoA ligase
MTHPTYFETFDIKDVLADYPVGDAFTARYARMRCRMPASAS